MIAATVPRAITILASFILARILGQSGFGEYGVINSTVGMVSTFSGLGLGATIVKHLAEFKITDPQRAGRIYTLTTIVNWISALIYAIVFILLAPWLASKTLAAPHLAPMLQISAISLAMGTINSLQQNVLTGLEAFRTSAFITIITSTVQSIILVLAAYFWQLTGVISALAINSIIIAFAYFYAIKGERRKYNIRLLWFEAKYEWEVLIKFSLPAFLGGILVGPAFWGANAILANHENGYAELGIINAANQWQQVIQFIPGILGAALLPIMSEKFGSGDQIGSLKIMGKMMRIYALIVFPAALILSLFSPLIMSGYGKSFESGYITLIITFFTAALLAVMAPVGQFIAASSKMWTGFLMNLGWAFCLISGSYLLVKFGAVGIAGAKFIAYFVHSIWVFGYVLFLKKKYEKQY
jgi:O-antigen/teichoic acid export membrane protein